MPKIIDHEQRKMIILKTAFSLFAEEGYQNTSLSQLAQTCGISRPTLYQYFRDKEEIFNYAVKHFTDEMYADYRSAASAGGPVLPIIRKIGVDIVVKCWLNRDFIISLGDFLIHMRNKKRNFAEAIHRRTVKLNHLLHRLIRDGIAAEEIQEIPVEAVVIQFLDLIQAFLFKIAILTKADPNQTIKLIEAYLNSLKRS